MDDNPILVITNLVVMLFVVFAIISAPEQYLRRRKKKKNGLLVTPRKVIIRQWLKTSLIVGLILMPITSYLLGSELHSMGVPFGDIIFFILTEVIIGNILTTLGLGYTIAYIRKGKWSYSRNPHLAQVHQE